MEFNEYLPLHLPTCYLLDSSHFAYLVILKFQIGRIRPDFLRSHLAEGNWTGNARKTNRETCHKYFVGVVSRKRCVASSWIKIRTSI